MEVMLWEVLLRNARKRCESTSTRSCWLAPVTKEGKNDGHEIRLVFTKQKAPAEIKQARCLSCPLLP